MRNKTLILLVLLYLLPVLAWCATQNFSFSCVTKVVRGEYAYYETRWHTYQFTIEVISDQYGTKPEYHYYRNPFIQAYAGERYSVRINNPMPVRVAVNLMIDGLNSITGSPCSPESGHKWLIEPYSSITIQGWQVDRQSMRRFYFTSLEDSYASWRSYQLGRDLTIKCGIISAAYFFNKQEMEYYFERNPIYEGPIVYRGPYVSQESKKNGMAADRENMPAPRYHQEKAGTGMGERGGHTVESVNFQYNTGMYHEREMVKIYYDFQLPYQQTPPYRPYRKYYNHDGEFSPEKP